ncbi:nucleoside hydrolase [Halobacillus litoralis]|uniref:nucleoside hydrolase n=1 Tax=Halobacillus litoralis TaxID=45668 RepID=UPI001CFEA159|nr:nucleoside hydrolase [Halobacillus litoralis]
MKKIILFADPGIDDSIAIMYALLNPKIQILAIVSSYGNVAKEQATNNVAYLLKLAGRSDVPVIGGANAPLDGEIPEFYPEIHGPDGLGPIQVPKTFKGELTNFSELYTLLRNHKDITIVDLGRNTSLASLFLLGNLLTENISEIFMMGGAFLVPGNVTPYAEANFYGDPVATNVVLSNLNNIFIIPLNVTNKAIITPDHVKKIMKESSNGLVNIMDDIMSYYISAYKKLVPGIKGAPLHDVLTLSLMVNPLMGKYAQREVEVLTSSEGRGISVADFRENSKPAEREIHICLEFDYPMFIEDLISVICNPLKTDTSKRLFL